MSTNIHKDFLKLVRLGIGTSKDTQISKDVDWMALKVLDRWFYFYKGITIADGNASVVMTSEAKKDFSLYDTDVPLKECKYCKGMQ